MYQIGNEEKLVIVLIDGGVETTHPALRGAKILSYSVTRTNSSYGIVEGSVDENGHGTAIASLLYKKIPDALFISFCIYNDTLEAEVDKLIYTLKYIYTNVKCNIVHLSLGTRIDNPELRECCKKLWERNTVVLAAFDNSGGISFPAAYPEVLGVDTTRRISKEGDYIYVKNSIVNILARKGNKRLAWKNGKKIVNEGTSFALPTISGIVAKHIKSGVSNDQLLNLLEKNASAVMSAPDITEEESECEKKSLPTNVYVFPYNKETQSLVNFSDQLSFRLKGILDIKESLNVGRTVKSIDGRFEYTVENIDTHQFSSNEGLVLGHVQDLERITHKEIKCSILDRCLESQSPVYMFDMDQYEKYNSLFKDSGVNLFCPKTNSRYGQQDRFGMLYKIASPVLGIFGTSAKQGKFTLQLILRRFFTEDGYKIAQLGSEPQAGLFGMDAIYPYGYLGSVNVQGLQAIQYLNQVMHELDMKMPDIILVGSQSGSVSMLNDNLGQIPLQTSEFLWGTDPDAIVLCVNAFDSIQYIVRTLHFLESATGHSRVIALCLFPMDMNNGWHIMNQYKKKMDEDKLKILKDELSTAIGLPVFVNGDESDMMELYKLCRGFFS